MSASPALSPSAAVRRGPGASFQPLVWIAGVAATLAATVVAGVVAVLFAAALAVVAVLALVLVLLAAAAAKARGGRPASPAVLSARWTGYGWDAR